jgi:hypothetical protein
MRFSFIHSHRYALEAVYEQGIIVNTPVDNVGMVSGEISAILDAGVINQADGRQSGSANVIKTHYHIANRAAVAYQTRVLDRYRAGGGGDRVGRGPDGARETAVGAAR